MTWPNLTARPRPDCDREFRYGPDRLQVVDLWLPAGVPTGRWPVVLMVHGGCWQSSIADRRLMDWVAADLRAAGIAVWNIDYRGVDRDGGGYPGTFADAAAAADLLHDHADACRLDTDRVVAVGHSAGGHLALWLAARHRLPAHSPLADTNPLPVAHVVSLGGLPDLAAVEASPDNGCGTDVIAQLVGGDRTDRFADTSVTELLPVGVPIDLVDGEQDRIVPARMAPAFAEAARAASDRVALHRFDDTGHVEQIVPDSVAWLAARRLIEQALGQH